MAGLAPGQAPAKASVPVAPWAGSQVRCTVQFTLNVALPSSASTAVGTGPRWKTVGVNVSICAERLETVGEKGERKGKREGGKEGRREERREMGREIWSEEGKEGGREVHAIGQRHRC